MAKPNSNRWEVRSHNLFRIYQSIEDSEDKPLLKATLLLQVSESGKAEDNFRFSLEGSRPLEAETLAGDLLKARSLHKYLLRIEVDPASIELRKNSLASPWVNLDEAIDEGAVHPHLREGGQLAREEFLADWNVAREEDPDLGASTRWALMASSDGLKLEWQGLPGKAGALARDPRLNCDACPAICLSTIGAEVDMSPRGPLHGPVPVLFSRNEAKTVAHLKRHPANLYPGEIKRSNLV